MQRILVGFDGSEPSVHALDQAVRIAQAFGSSITVLTAASDRLVRADGTVTMALDESHGLECAEMGAQRARQAGVADVVAKTSLEAPGDALALEAREGYDLLVVGHRSHNPIEELFVGSTAKWVVDQVHCSVLITR